MQRNNIIFFIYLLSSNYICQKNTIINRVIQKYMYKEKKIVYIQSSSRINGYIVSGNVLP